MSFALGRTHLSTISISDSMRQFAKCLGARSTGIPQVHEIPLPGQGCEEWVHPEPTLEHWAVERRQAGTWWERGNMQTTDFPGAGRGIGCLKLDVVVISEFFPAASSYPAIASSPTAMPWDISGPGCGGRGRPLLASPFPDTCFCWILRKVKCSLVGVAGGGWQRFMLPHLRVWMGGH